MISRRSLAPQTVETPTGVRIAHSHAEAVALRKNFREDVDLLRTHQEIDRQKNSAMTSAKKELDWKRQRAEEAAEYVPSRSPLLRPRTGYHGPGYARDSLRGVTSELVLPPLKLSASMTDSPHGQSARVKTNLLSMGAMTRSTPTLRFASDDQSYDHRTALSSSTGSAVLLRTPATAEPWRARRLPQLPTTVAALQLSRQNTARSCGDEGRQAPSFASPMSSRRQASTRPLRSKKLTSSSPCVLVTPRPPATMATDCLSSSTLTSSSNISLKGNGNGTSSAGVSLSTRGGGHISVVRVLSVVGPAPESQSSSESSDSDRDSPPPKIWDEEDAEPDTLLRKNWATSREVKRRGITMEEAKELSYVRLPNSHANTQENLLADRNAAKLVFRA